MRNESENSEMSNKKIIIKSGPPALAFYFTK